MAGPWVWAAGSPVYAGVTPVNIIIAVVHHDLRPRFPQGVGQCRLPVPKPVLKAPMVSALD
jgi:hypothetical protein